MRHHLGYGLLLLSASSFAQGYKQAAIKPFQLPRYLGSWKEVVRFNSWFEPKGMKKVTATYTGLPDGTVEVLNQGYMGDKKRQARGKAKFGKDPNLGLLRVSFFGPFYSDYVIADVDEKADDYGHALVFSKGRMWILGRTTELDKTLVDRLLDKATTYGYDRSKAVFVEH